MICIERLVGMETANIYVTGSGDPHTRFGFASVLIEQSSRKMPLVKSVFLSSHDRQLRAKRGSSKFSAAYRDFARVVAD